MESSIHYRPNPRYHADSIHVDFGSSQDSRLVYDGTNNEWTVQSKDSGGTQTDRLKVASGGDITTAELYNDDPGTTGIRLDSHHDSASPAASDVLLDHRIYGEDDGGAKTQYAGITFVLVDPTNASEDGRIDLKAMVAGTLTTMLQIGDVVVVPDSQGMVVGHTAALVTATRTSRLQVVGTDGDDDTFSISSFRGASANGPRFILMKSRETTPGSFTIVADNDRLGNLE